MAKQVIIIGSGPAGYTAAIYTARAGLEPIVLAGSIGFGGALMETTLVENYPGFVEGIQGPELMDAMRDQAERFGAEIIFDDVLSVDFSGTEKIVRTDENEYRAPAVIIATGSAHRTLGLPEEETFAGKGVSYCATCDGFFFRDKPIVVVGGGDSAVEEATFLTRFGSSVTLVHRRDELRASKAMADRAKADPKLDFAWNSVVESINGDTTVESVTLKDTVTGETREIPAAGVFISIGHNPRSDIFRGQLDVAEDGYIPVTAPGTATSAPGVFSCGDVTDSHYQQAITAAASGCRAALDAQHYLTAGE